MKKVFASRSFWQVFGTAMATSAVLLTVTATVASNHYEKALLARMEKEHHSVAERISKEMGLFFGQAEMQLRLTADLLSVLNPAPERIRTVLNEIALDAPHFSEIRYIDKSGMEIATSEPQKPGLKLSEITALEHALKAENWISPVVFNANRIAFITMSVPLYDLDRPVGLLIAKMSLKKLWWWIDEINTLAETRLSVVESKNGLVVADQQKTRLGQVHPFWSAKKESGVIKTSNGERFIAHHDIPGVQMEIVTESGMKTFLCQLHEMRYSIVVLVLVLLLFSSFIAAYAGMKTSKPLQKIINGMLAYGKSGNKRIGGKFHGEYREIVEAFNQTATAVENHQNQLIEQENIVTIGRTVAGVSHEIRHGFTRVINLMYDAEGYNLKTLEKVKSEIFDMSNKMNDLLEFSKARQLKYREVAVIDILFMAKEQVRYRKEAVNNEILLENIPKSAIIRADASKMTLAIANLIRNSIEAGGKDTIVRLSSRTYNGMVEFCVSDNGPGIPPEIRNKVFEPFFTTKSRGFGIGLSLVNTIAKAHNGRAYMTANGANGVEMKITIPANKTAGKNG